MAMIMALGLVACGNHDKPIEPLDPDISNTKPVETPSDEVSDDTVDLAKFYEDIMAAAGTAPAMMEITSDLVDGLYPGLSDIELKQCVLYTPAIGAVAVEFAFVEVVNEDDVAAVESIFRTRIDTQIESGAFYPSTVEGWQKHASIVNDGNIVCLFVCAEKDGMIEALLHGTEVPAWGEAPAEDMPVSDVVMPEEPVVDMEVELPVGGMNDGGDTNTDAGSLDTGVGASTSSDSVQG